MTASSHSAISHRLLQREGDVFFAMRQEQLAGRLFKVPQPVEQSGPVGMSRESEQLRDLCFHVILASVDPNAFLSIENSSPERTVGLKTDEQERRFGAADVVSQVMFDPPGVAHAGRGHDDARSFDMVDRL